MNESQALRLQIWAFRNLELNYALKELGDDGTWTVALGLPDGSSRRLDGSSVRVSATFDLVQPSPRQAWLRLRGGASMPAFDVPISCLVDGCRPTVYDALDGRFVLVF